MDRFGSVKFSGKGLWSSLLKTVTDAKVSWQRPFHSKAKGFYYAMKVLSLPAFVDKENEKYISQLFLPHWKESSVPFPPFVFPCLCLCVCLYAFLNFHLCVWFSPSLCVSFQNLYVHCKKEKKEKKELAQSRDHKGSFHKINSQDTLRWHETMETYNALNKQSWQKVQVEALGYCTFFILVWCFCFQRSKETKEKQSF